MRILWLTIDRSKRVTKHFDRFRAEVSKYANLEVIEKSTEGILAGRYSTLAMRGLIKPERLIKGSILKEKFDFVFSDAMFAYMEESLDNFESPKAMLIEDAHGEVPKWQVDFAKKRGVEIIFYRYEEAFKKFHKDAEEDYRCYWLPHSIDLSVYKDYGYRRTGVLHIGRVNDHYPVRKDIISLLRNKEYFRLIKRPREDFSNFGKWPVDEDYVKLINSAKICVTGGSSYNTPVLKYFEIPACGTVLMSNWFSDLDKLGFVDGDNVVRYGKDVSRQIEFMLRKGEEKRLEKIGKRGRTLMIEKHSVSKRAMWFINKVEEIING